MIQPPELGELKALTLPHGDGDVVEIEGVRIDDAGEEPLAARRLEIRESELIGVTVAAGHLPGLRLADVRLTGCDLSNVDGREGTLQRVEVSRSRLVGIGLTGASVRDLSVRDSVLTLAGFGFATLRDVRFERANLAEASFLDTHLTNVSFVDCRLEGADFRGAKLQGCSIRGASLQGILGISSMRGITMSWPDVLGSAAAMAAALGIEVEGD